MNRTSIDELGGGSALVPVNPNAIALGGQFEQQAHVLAAQAKAKVEARYIVAMRRPRNWDDVRSQIMKECNRPSFANDKSAYYKKPIGDGAEGLGIRFAEMALAKMTNVTVTTETVYEDENRETVRVSVTDLESNYDWSLDVRITKTVERRKPLDDGTYVSVRTNSSGGKTYTVPATDDDLLNKRAALISKAARGVALRIVPGDIQAEAEAAIKATRLDNARKDPDAERRKVVDAFAELGIRAEHLVDFLGHSLEQCSPAELVELRAFYSALDGGETTWPAILAHAEERRKTAAEGAAAAARRAAERTKRDGDKGAAEAGKKDPAPKDPPKPKGNEPAPKPTPTEEPRPTPEANKPAASPAAANAPQASAAPAGEGSNAPTLEDALRAVNAGDDGLAADIARTLGEEAQRKVSLAMEARDSGGGTLPGFE